VRSFRYVFSCRCDDWSQWGSPVAMARGTVTVQTILAWDTGLMVMFRLNGDVSSENLTAIGPLLAQLLDGQVTPSPRTPDMVAH